MTNKAPGVCETCGQPASFHYAQHGVPNSVISYCDKHTPDGSKMAEEMKPPSTPAELVIFLQNKLNTLEQIVADPVKRSMIKRALEHEIAKLKDR